MNRVTLIGRLGAVPEAKITPNGAVVCQVNLATSTRFKGKDGEKKERAEWHRLVFWNRRAEIVAEYCVKGSQIYIEGELQTRKWTDTQNVDHYTTEIIVSSMELLGSRQSSDSSQSAPPLPQPSTSSNHDEFDDDIPF